MHSCGMAVKLFKLLDVTCDPVTIAILKDGLEPDHQIHVYNDQTEILVKYMVKSTKIQRFQNKYTA